MALTRKRKVFLSIFLPSLVLTIFIFTFGAYWCVELLSCGHYVKEGIENYSPAASSVSLCAFLTVRQERNHGDSYVPFIEKWPLTDSCYRYEYNYNNKFKCETAILSLTYNKKSYEEAYEDVSSQKGFSPKLIFDYKHYSFRLNDTEKIISASSGSSSCFTSYDIEENFISLKWINLVGWCEERNTLVFIGFYYNKNNAGYKFDNWDDFLQIIIRSIIGNLLWTRF